MCESRLFNNALDVLGPEYAEYTENRDGLSTKRIRVSGKKAFLNFRLLRCCTPRNHRVT